MKIYDIQQKIIKKYIPEAKKTGCPLPTMREMAVRFKVSRETVRKAVRYLKQQNKVYTVPGSGIFVKSESRATSYSADTAENKEFMIGVTSKMKPVVKVLIIETRDNFNLYKIIKKFNEEELLFKVELHVSTTADLLVPVTSFDLILASAHILHSWQAIVGFWDLRKLTSVNLTNLLAKMFKAAAMSCVKDDEVIALPYFQSLYLLYMHKNFFREASPLDLDWDIYINLCENYLKNNPDSQKLLLPRLFSLFFSADCWPDFKKNKMHLDRTRTANILKKIKSCLTLFKLEGPELKRKKMIPKLIKGNIPFLDFFTGDLRKLAKMKKNAIQPTNISFEQSKIMGNSGIGGIPLNSIHPEQAMKFLLYLANASNQKILARAGQDLPARKDCFSYACPTESLQPMYNKIFSFCSQSTNICNAQNPFFFTYMFDYVFPEIYLFWENLTTLDDTLNKLDQLANRFVVHTNHIVETQQNSLSNIHNKGGINYAKKYQKGDKSCAILV